MAPSGRDAFSLLQDHLRYPATDVAVWLGNSPRVADRHYLMAMKESFQRAIVDGAQIKGVTTGLPSKANHTLHDSGDQGMSLKTPRNPPPQPRLWASAFAITWTIPNWPRCCVNWITGRLRARMVA